MIGEVYGEAVADYHCPVRRQYERQELRGAAEQKGCRRRLIGGASLKAPDFAVIVNAATKLIDGLNQLFQRPAAPHFQRCAGR